MSKVMPGYKIECLCSIDPKQFSGKLNVIIKRLQEFEKTYPKHFDLTIEEIEEVWNMDDGYHLSYSLFGKREFTKKEKEANRKRAEAARKAREKKKKAKEEKECKEYERLKQKFEKKTK